ncbi:type I restriction endonuclease subunit R [Bartonella sp. HY329]|uniref:type I restriction endonuclease subunit R n=1 Tax=unclassified Bartonella TaxID=2645622 RepID=UPI0021CA2E14|nr:MULTISPECIES: type I restriction endonuclease subunit R [unclassified Bartonella]UXM94441.1 type I restriction endonuclease subunit R [Bartonella sp. HY329]UXN08765.1 type I restriction endonuclease subunit R [Bartonella sp. HY328]
MTTQTTPIAETNRFIVLDKYEPLEEANSSYQSEYDLENELLADLAKLGFEVLPKQTSQSLYANLRVQIERLNAVRFLDVEWQRFLLEFLDKPSENMVDKARKIHDSPVHDFTFDDGRLQNIHLLDKKTISNNHLQVMRQFEQHGSYKNIYDVTILVNGLPLVHVELKRRGVAIREAFNQIHRYSKESLNSDGSLFKYIQLFVISNGTDTRFFANSLDRNKNSFEFTMNWAQANNELIKDLKDFTNTFFQKNTLLNVLLHYSVLDISNNLLVMRPYQIAATERILWKIESAYHAKNWSNLEAGGFIWHTTGSGKTLTSFKAARLATELPFIDKVFFVVDRKDLDYQTMKEYQKFSPDSVNGSDSTAGLKRNILSSDNKIIVTTIQKLNNLMKSEDDLAIYDSQVVFIFDEAHRSQFGEAQKNLKKKFKKYYQFGFTGTPIFPENSLGAETTASVFGKELHAYVITDAIRDEKVLKFKVDYNDVRPQFASLEKETDEQKLSAAENKQALLHPARIAEISQYVLDHFKQKTHRLNPTGKGFNAMFAVSSVDAAKAYYECLQNLQKDSAKPLKIATIFSFAANEEQNAIGDIIDENFEPTAMDLSAKEFLASAVKDYNAMFNSKFGLDSKEFQNYYRDLAKRVKNQDIDLVIVVGMFLTGFDAPSLNTLFVDKNLRFHGLIQAFSRTNRILDATKTFGNIVTFRDLEQNTIDAITLFGNKKTRDVVLEKSFEAYLNGFTDEVTGRVQRGYIEIVNELQQRFANPQAIETEKDKRDFAKLFGEYLRIENILQNYDEFAAVQALQNIDKDDAAALEEFMQKYHVSDDDVSKLQTIPVVPVKKAQDYRSTYNDIRDWIRKEQAGKEKDESSLDWGDVVFEVDLLKSQEINLDYILKIIFDHNKQVKDKAALVEEVRRMLRASFDNRAKEDLVVEFINQVDLDKVGDKDSMIEAFYDFARAEQKREVEALILQENIKEVEAKNYISTSLKRNYASDEGTELNDMMQKMSPLNPNYMEKKQGLFQKISAFVDKFKGVGGSL